MPLRTIPTRFIPKNMPNASLKVTKKSLGPRALSKIVFELRVNLKAINGRPVQNLSS